MLLLLVGKIRAARVEGPVNGKMLPGLLFFYTGDLHVSSMINDRFKLTKDDVNVLQCT